MENRTVSSQTRPQVMDLQPSPQGQQYGPGSWHPAMRPNAHEDEYAKEGQQIAETSPPSTASEDEATHIPASYQLPFRPKSTPENQPLCDSFEADHLQSAQQVEDSMVATRANAGSSRNDLSVPESQDRRNFQSGERSGEQMDDGWDAGTNRTNIVEPAPLSRDLNDNSKSDDTRRKSLALDIGQANNPPSSTATSHLEGAIGDKVEMDKAWELEERDTPANRMAHVNRTNSFPTIPPSTQSKPVPSQSLPQSHAEDVMKGEETAGFPNHELPSNTFSASHVEKELPGDVFREIVDEGDEAFFANPQSGEGVVKTLTGDEESRYEEGLPLMSASQSEDIFLPQGEVNGVVAESPNGVVREDDFYNNISSGSPDATPTFTPKPLDRKSTTQVLGSMHFAPHSANHAGQEVEGVAKQSMDIANSKPKDEDLAEIWKAALGDDDLLEDNEESVDPSAFFDGDEDGFLEGDQDYAREPQSQSVAYPGTMQGYGEGNSKQAVLQDSNLLISGSRFTPHTQQVDRKTGLYYTPSAPKAGSEAARQAVYQPQQPQPASRPLVPASTQSFADKSKGGYTSPYDLPMDVTRPKKRTAYQQMHPSSDIQQSSSRPPPPRSSSMFTGAPPPVDSRPPIPQLPSAYSPSQAGHAISPALKASPSMGSFSEELPSTNSRPPSSMGKFAPAAPQRNPPLPTSSQIEPSRQSPLPHLASSNSLKSSQQYELLPSERMSLYGNTSQPEAAHQVVPAMNARYSPAPTQPTSVPPPRNRYAASPSAGNRPPQSQILPFQPRTSSPLAQSSSQPQPNQQDSFPDPSLRLPQTSVKQSIYTQDPEVSRFPFPHRQGSQSMESVGLHNESGIDMKNSSEWRSSPPPSTISQQTRQSTSSSNPPLAIRSPKMEHEFPHGSSSLHQNREVASLSSDISSRGPPRRSQTQSPGAFKYTPQSASAQAPYQRPASVNHQISTPSLETTLPSGSNVRPRGRTLSKDLNFIRPSDGRELDQLERWKGCPIFSFGFGGAIVTSFPKQIPRFAAGQASPMIKCSPGEVNLQDGKILPLEEDIANFPGPLKSKSKKKDAVDWLQRRISRLENDVAALSGGPSLPDPTKRHEEKILLWEIVRILVEHDGVLDGNTSAEKAVRFVLSPELAQGDTATLPLQNFNASLVGITRHSGSRINPDSIDPESLESLRKLLLHGERAKAVWHAVDNRLWAHAMLLSSTLDQNIWKQVSQEFVRQEVKTYGENTEALAALYQMFAGNGEDSADELVPPSARAGLQMVSKTAGTGPTKNALDGLDRWREALTLILSNRSSDDSRALTSLGQLLAGYGRTEAAHICYIFAKSPNLFGGPDDPQVSISLLGADHLQQPFDYGRDLDSILLTEMYDFARTVLSSAPVATVSPHLQPFKLYHAMILAEYGHKSEAQQYCEVITSTLNSTTKRSPYYHALLLEALNSFMERLRQAPRDSSGSWISKPSMDKVSGSIWAKFNQYVVGDESDAASVGSGRGHDTSAGPFAGVAGDSPTLSRTPSSNDLYNSYAPGISSAPMANPSKSRYAPAGLYTPRSSLEEQGRLAQDSQRPAYNDSLRPQALQQAYQSRPTSSTTSYHEPYRPVASENPVRTESSLPTPSSQPQYMATAPPDELSSYLYQYGIDDPNLPAEPQESQGLHEGHARPVLTNGYDQSLSSYNTELSAYEPPSSDHYDPPGLSSYDPPPYGTNDFQMEASTSDEKPKRSFMDDDDEDDFEARAAAIRKEEKARKDREADEAFRRAAEADGKQSVSKIPVLKLTLIAAQKDKVPKLNTKKSGWFGGWLGGKMPEGEDAHGTPNAPIKAKLGEQSSFYYDPEQKRWVNKKDPDLTPAAKAPPPPPKGPPSRAVSASGPPFKSASGTPPVPPLPSTTATPPITFTRPPTSNLPSSKSPSQHPSRNSSPAMNANTGPATGIGAPTVPSGPPSAPPSRPATGMSGASSIDDLLGAPQARKGGTIRKGKKKGYVDVMAK